MSQKLIVPSPSIQRLIDEGYEIEIRHQHLLVHSVPYVTEKNEIALGTIVCTDVDPKPKDHTVWFRGEMPCTAQGKPLSLVVNNSNGAQLFDDFKVQHYFSNKPSDVPDFPADHYAKVVHYVGLLSAQARVIDPNADARTGKAILSRDENPIFRYPDSASARAGIVAISQKLTKMTKIAIIGTGGTGGYILDQVAKTPVREIHLYDGDDMKRHNAFRAPGAIPLEALIKGMKKVDYYHDVYELMRSGVIPHPYNIDENTVNELAIFDFVFISVDNGPARKLISTFLVNNNIPFIDVGMGLEVIDDSLSLSGLCRVTLSTPSKHDHLSMPSRLPIDEDNADAAYISNIQVGDMNALNAILAVIKWKQYCGFYADTDQAHYLSYSVGLQSIARAEPLAVST